ncbi:hypothetical protein [Streptomyces sporangiiformans]|nr:hypothetical protein [Streptomyces sporangiiformans]
MRDPGETEVYDSPDFADGGWQATGIVDLRPGPIGAVTVAAIPGAVE